MGVRVDLDGTGEKVKGSMVMEVVVLHWAGGGQKFLAKEQGRLQSETSVLCRGWRVHNGRQSGDCRYTFCSKLEQVQSRLLVEAKLPRNTPLQNTSASQSRNVHQLNIINLWTCRHIAGLTWLPKNIVNYHHDSI